MLLLPFYSQLEFAELQIKNMYSPWDDETYWGLCNTIGDEASRLGTHLDKAEVGVCFNILKELQDLEGGEMSLVEAQNVSTERDLPVAEVGRIIQKLHQLHWLRIARRDGEVKLTPGPRAIIELPQVRQWTRDVGREKRMKERELALNRVKKDEDEYEEEQAGRGRKRRSSQAEADEREQEIEQEIEEEIVPARSRGRPRAVRRGGRRSSRR